MDNIKQSIRFRFIFALIVIITWAVEMVPFSNQDYFAFIEKQSEKNIKAKLTDESKIKELMTALNTAIEKNQKIDTKETREALLDARKAKADYEKKEKRRADDPVPMTRSGALLNAAGNNVALYKYIDVPGVRSSNKKTVKYVEKVTAGKLKAGIDLKGGVEFTMEFKEADLKGAGPNGTDLNSADTRDAIVEILRSRIDSKGLAEVELRPFSDTSIMIRVPAVNDEEVAAIRNMLMRQAKLEFRAVLQPGDPRAEMVESPGDPGGFIWLGDVQMDGKNIEKAFATQDENGSWMISKTFNTEGAKEFADVSGRFVGSRLAIVLDNVCYSAPNIQERIGGGQARITGSFSKEEAQELAIVLQSGSMPVQLFFAGESRTDPTLGAESVRSGIISCAVGLLLVLIFMIVYYKKAGVIAVIALVVNILLVVGTMAILGATFTLPGIAGIILTIGMAVDTNVLIFERIREELATGKTLFNSTREGFSKAFVTIFDANITTLLTCFILMKFGSGPIQGFAYTLAIGIACSMFTGIFISRIFFDYMTQDHSIKELSGFSSRPDRTIDFWALRKKCLLLSTGMVIFSIIIIASKGSDLLSVDFSGGNALTYSVLDDSVTQDSVESGLKAAGFTNPKAIFKSGLGDPTKHLEVVVKEGNNSFEDLKANLDNSGLYAKIDGAVRGSIEADKMPRISQLTVGGVVGNEFQKQALIAIGLSLLVIFLYITLRFESIFAIGAIVALCHDTVIAIGFYALVGHQISLPIIAALLTLIGYSLNDTIVVFDRIRENSGEIKKKSVVDIMNNSINSSFNRTLLTSLTTLLVVVILTIFGGGDIADFALILVIGVIIGTYSSIAVAAPIVCNSKLGAQLDRIQNEKNEREEKKLNDQTVMAD
jgi:SecD/SecF fusion protein